MRRAVRHFVLMALPIAFLSSQIEARSEYITNIAGAQLSLISQGLGDCDSCHGGTASPFDDAIHFDILDSGGNSIFPPIGNQEYVPGETYTVSMDVYIPSNATGGTPDYRAYYRVKLDQPDSGIFQAAPAGAELGNTFNAVSHLVNTNDPGAEGVDLGAAGLDAGFGRVEFEWVAPDHGEDIIFSTYSMGTNGDADGVGATNGAGGDFALNNRQTLTIAGPQSDEDGDIPDLVDPDNPSTDNNSDPDSSEEVSDSGSGDNSSGNFTVTRVEAGCSILDARTTDSVNNSSSLAFLIFSLLFLLSFSTLRTWKLLSDRQK